MEDALESEISSRDEISIKEVHEDSEPIIFAGDHKKLHFSENNTLDSRNGTYLQLGQTIQLGWCITDKNENTTELVEFENKENFSSTEDEIIEMDNENFSVNIEKRAEGNNNRPETDVVYENKVEIDEESDSVPDDKEPNVNSFFNIQPIPTLEELAASDYVHNRQLAVRKILEFLKQAGSNEKDLQSVISVMCKLSEDEEAVVQFDLMQQIPDIASYCQSEPHLQIVIRQQLMPYTVRLLNDSQVIIRKSGQSALLVLLEKHLVDHSQLIEWICPLIAQLVMCEINLEELRIEDVTFMTRMIPLVGRETTLKFFRDPFISLCCDPCSGIRKVCVLGFGILCQVVGVEITELSLLPAFLNLCNDEIWQVRKACAGVFVDVANSVTPKTRKEILPHIFVNLLTDNHNNVKVSAYQNLGNFIYTFADPEQSGCLYRDGNIVIDFKKSLEEVNTGDKTESFESKASNLETSLDKWKSGQFRKVRKRREISESGSSVENCSLFFGSDGYSQNISKPDSSLAVAAKNGHVYLHVDNENVFNNFQFWRMPLPEIELDIDIEDGKATSIHVRATVQGNENMLPSSEIKVRIAPEESTECANASASRTFGINKMLVQTACINTLSSQEQRCLLDDDTEVLWSSFKEAVLTFKTDESERGSHCTNTSITTNINNTSIESEVRRKDASIMTPYEQDIVPPILLYSFISVVNDYPCEANKASEDEKLGYIAYSFPAVALTLGRGYWPCIRKTCEKLARNMKWTVRRTIASSLHELATILGYDIIMSDLLPIFLDLFKDVDEVRLRLVQHLSDFLKHLHLQDRKQFLPLIEEFIKVDNDKNWRFRCVVAEQLIKTSELYDPLEIPDYFLPVASTLLHDKVSAVRLAAVELMAVLLKHMHQDGRMENYYETMLEGYDDLYRQSPKWIWRQTYVKLCAQLAFNVSMPMEEFVERIVPKLFSLAWDEVPNVRLALVRCLLNTLIPMNLMSSIKSSPSSGLLTKMLDSLELDIDRDVRYYAEQCALYVIK